jgi:hypothetical protein
MDVHLPLVHSCEAMTMATEIMVEEKSSSHKTVSGLKFERSREALETGSCTKFDEWLGTILHPDFFLKVRDDGHHVPELGLHDFIDMDLYHSILKGYALKTMSYIAFADEKITIKSTFYERYCDNKFSKREFMDVKNEKEYCDYLFNILKLNIDYPICRTDSDLIVIESEMAHWDKELSNWDKSSTEIKSQITEFLCAVYSDQTLSEDNLCMLKIVDL